MEKSWQDMDSPIKILILGGTRNARDLAMILAKDERYSVITSLAGRTQEPDRTFGTVRVGGFGGPAGLAQYLIQNDIDILVDSTHPFATQISKNAQLAAEQTNTVRLVLDRPQWELQQGDNWIICENLDQAAEKLPANSIAFLALGHQHLSHFSTRHDVRFIARMVDQPNTDIPLHNHALVIAKPSHIAQEEAELFQQHAITHLVCRNSGGTLIYAKIEAARQLGLPILMISRPPQIDGATFETIQQLAAEIKRISS